MKLPPAVIVHGLAQARLAVAAGPVTLLSAPGAALYAGCGWWRALVAASLTAGPDVLDCADAPGRAMAALRVGQKALILAPDHPSFAAVAGAAATLGARLLARRPASFDPGPRDLDTAYGMAKLQLWLSDPTTTPVDAK